MFARALATHFFAFADGVSHRPTLTLVAIPACALVNGAIAFTGYGELPGISLALGVDAQAFKESPPRRR
jgi:hypothetical protein